MPALRLSSSMTTNGTTIRVGVHGDARGILIYGMPQLWSRDPSKVAYLNTVRERLGMPIIPPAAF